MDISFQEEKIIDLREEIEPLLIKHWEELANNKDTRPLDVDFDLYIKLNEDGFIKVFTARIEGELIGYASFFIANNLHYKTWKYATADVYYLDPAYRKQGLGFIFFKEIKEWLKYLEVKSVTVQDKLNHSHRDFFIKIGFTPVEQLYEIML